MPRWSGRPSFNGIETLVVSSKDIYPSKSAGYNWDEAGNSVSFTLNSTARTDATIDYQV